MVHLVNNASADLLVDPGLISGFSDNWSHALVDPVTAGPISRCSNSLSHQWIQLPLVPLVTPAAACTYVSPIKL